MKKRNSGPKVYRSYKPLKIVILSLIAAIVLFIIIFISAFFGLQKYIVYDDDGVRLDLPWREETTNTADNQ